MDAKLNRGVVIVAGGSGQRMGGPVPKQFMIVGGKPLLVRTINVFAEALPAAEIVVVLPEGQVDFWKNLSARFDVARHRIAIGGKERFDSVKAGIAALGAQTRFIAVQDGVRALVSKKLIIRALQTAIETGSAIPAIAPTDSFRETDDNGESHPVDRSRLRMIQTPQIFEAGLLRKAYETEYDPSLTDDATVVERSGAKVTLCEGERTNIKITTADDLTLAEAIIAEREQ